jgi:Ca2+-binding RTX toxin-like protein
VILTGPGNDVIDGAGANDRICSGGGEDRIVGGPGRDLIDSGPGEDSVEGGNGSDRILGQAGGDTLAGNRGNDQLDGGAGDGDFLDGGLGDDSLLGGPGAGDELIGDIGNDKLHGGAGDGDILRGDQGHDLFDGGAGEHDVASFATASVTYGGSSPAGVSVDLLGGRGGDGNDRFTEVEDVVGSPLGDQIRGNGSPNNLYGAGGYDSLQASGPGDAAFGGGGSAACAPLPAIEPAELFAGEDSCGPPASNPDSRVEVEVAGGPAATTLTTVVVRGEPPSLRGHLPPPIPGFHLNVAFEAGAWLIRGELLPISAGEGCVGLSSSEARCQTPNRIDSIFLDGGPGDDILEVDPSVPSYVSAVMRGEQGSDTLIGGGGDDSLEGSTDRSQVLSDTLVGRGGDDALVNGGSLRGGPGSDLLIGRVCDGEQIDGGPGVDSASFAREVERPDYTLRATIGGDAVFTGLRPSGAPCPEPGGPRTHIDTSVEQIEGSRNNDVLIGDGAANRLLGRGGDDVLLGKGGDDLLVGGDYSDRLFGGGGFDRLYGKDGRRDSRLSCGSGSGDEGVASIDHNDPIPAHCRLLK